MYNKLRSNILFLITLLPLAAIQADWIPPQAVSAIGQIALAPQIATDPLGNTVAIWYAFDGVNYAVFSATQISGGAEWSLPVRLSEAGQDAYFPAISVDALGNAVGVWFHYNGSHYSIKAATLPLGGHWSSSSEISSYGADAYNPQVATDSLGNAVAVWFQFDGSQYSVQSAFLPHGGYWSTPANVSNFGVDATYPVVGIDGLGNAYAAWNQYDGTNYTIETASLPFRGSWSYPTTVSNTGSNAYNPQIAVNGPGDVVVSWYYYDGVNYIIQAAAQPFRGNWSTPANLSDNGENASAAAIGIDSSGNAIAVWQIYNGTNYIIQSAHLPFGGAWSSPENISTFGVDAYDPAIAVNSSGDAVAVWYAYDGTNYVVKGATRAAGTSWSLVIELSDACENADRPQVAIDAAGEVFVVWQDNANWAIVETEGNNLFVII